MKKAWQLNITGPGDWNFNKDNFIGIEIQSDEYLNFEHYEDALDFINSINSTDKYSDNFVSAAYLISEFDTYPEKTHNKGEINIPYKFLSEEVIMHNNEQTELENKDKEIPYYELSEGEEFLEVDKNRFE